MESFNKFKKKILIEVLLKCIFAGLSVGLIALSVPLMLIKLKVIEFNILYVVLISISLMLLVGGLTFLILKPNKIKIAKRIDKEFNMNEKVQTMVEFENKEGFMVELQREDTLNILSSKPVKGLSMRFSIVLLILLVISCGSCVTALAIPKYTEPTDTPTTEITDDPTYVVDDWTKVAIRNIIEKVNASTAEESLKVKYVSMLEQLIVELDNIDKESELKAYVTEMISEIMLELDKVNTNNEVFMVLKDSDNSLVTSLAVEINLLDSKDVRKQIENIAALIYGSAAAVEEFHNDFGVILRSSNLNKKDDLYLNLYKLAEDIYETRNASDVRTAVDAAINSNIENIISVVDLQAENFRIAHYIEYELNSIFGIEEEKTETATEEEDLPTENPYEDDEKEDENKNNSGGLGTGQILFGSNDAFFDPEKGVVVYGDVITSYYGEILGKLNEGTLDESLREYFEYYYDMLLGDDKLNEE